MVTRTRSILKTITWRSLATMITTGIAYLVTGSIDLAMGIGAIDTIIKLIAYYLHERMWDATEYGR